MQKVKDSVASKLTKMLKVEIKSPTEEAQSLAKLKNDIFSLKYLVSKKYELGVYLGGKRSGYTTIKVFNDYNPQDIELALESYLIKNKVTDSIETIVSFDVATSIAVLKQALSMEVVQFWQYFAVKDFLISKCSSDLKMKFEWFSSDELHDHASKILARLYQLGVKSQEIWSLVSLVQQVDYPAVNFSDETVGQIVLNVFTETKSIAFYENAVSNTTSDVVTCNMLQGFLKDEQEHLSALVTLYSEVIGTPSTALDLVELYKQNTSPAISDSVKEFTPIVEKLLKDGSIWYLGREIKKNEDGEILVDDTPITDIETNPDVLSLSATLDDYFRNTGSRVQDSVEVNGIKLNKGNLVWYESTPEEEEQAEFIELVNENAVNLLTNQGYKIVTPDKVVEKVKTARKYNELRVREHIEEINQQIEELKKEMTDDAYLNDPKRIEAVEKQIDKLEDRKQKYYKRLPNTRQKTADSVTESEKRSFHKALKWAERYSSNPKVGIVDRNSAKEVVKALTRLLEEVKKQNKVSDVSKEEQTDALKEELYKLVQQFVWKYWRMYYPQYKGETSDLIVDFFEQFLTEKGRGEKKENLLDKFDPSMTSLPYLVKTAVIRMLIDRSRTDKGEVNYSEQYDEETGELSLDFLSNLVNEDEVSIDEIEFTPEQIFEIRDLYDELPEADKKHFIRMYKEVKNVLAPNFQALFKDLVGF